MTYPQIEKYIFEKLPMFQNVGGIAYKPTLENTLALCEHLGNPQKNLKFIHVAGTNGKGSVSHSLASIWQTVGYKVGLYTSPHLKTYRERMCVNGEMIQENEVIYWINQLKPKIEEILPSFFEATTAMAFAHFAQKNVDIVILETGMGGRLDATNIITPLVSVITNIGYDHQKFLGDTLPLIAGEKAGIIKKNVPVVIGEYHEETINVFLEKAQKENSILYKAWENFESDFLENDFVQIKNKFFYQENTQISDKNESKKKFGFEKIQFLPSLKGIYQKNNFVTIAQTVSLLAEDWHITNDIFQKALENVTNITHLKGRWQILDKSPLTICDTAHNEQGFEQLFKQFEKTIFSNKITNIIMILGFAKDKDYLDILKKIDVFFENLKEKYQNSTKNSLEINYIFTSFPLERALSAQILAEEAEKNLNIQAKYFSTVKESLNFAKQNLQNNDLNVEQSFIFVGGSNFIVAEIPNL